MVEVGGNDLRRLRSRRILQEKKNQTTFVFFESALIRTERSGNY